MEIDEDDYDFYSDGSISDDAAEIQDDIVTGSTIKKRADEETGVSYSNCDYKILTASEVAGLMKRSIDEVFLLQINLSTIGKIILSKM